MNNFQIVLKNTLFLSLSEIFLKVLGFFWFVYLARHLSIDLFGRYNLVNSFIAIFSFLPDLGIGLVVIREIAKNKTKAALYLGNAFFLNGTFALFTIIIILLTVSFFSYSFNVTSLVFIASITLFLSTLRSVAIFYFDGVERMHISALLNSINTLLSITGGFVGISLGFGIVGVFLGMLSGTFISLIITWFLLIKNSIRPTFTFDTNIVKHLFLEGLPLGLAAFSFMLYSRVDSLLLHNILGESAVAIYSTAMIFVSSFIQLLNVPFVVAVFPALTRLQSADNIRFKHAVKKSMLLIVLWSFPLAVLVSIFAFVIPYIFGVKYEPSVPILRVLIFFVPFASLSALLYKILIIKGKQLYYLFISIIGAIINILLNLFLIPTYSVIGAAYASVLTQAIVFSIYLVVTLRLIMRK